MGFALGSEFEQASALLTWLIGAATLELAGAALRPASYTLGRARESLVVQALGAIVYVFVYWTLTPTWGLHGPCPATATLYAIVLVGSALVVRHALATKPVLAQR